MGALPYRYTRAKLADMMRRVDDDHAPVIVTTQRGKPVVIMSLDDWDSVRAASTTGITWSVPSKAIPC